MRKTIVVLVALCVAPELFAQNTGLVQTTTVTLTSAQLQNLRANPITLVAAPGAGNYVNATSAILQYKAGGAAYGLPGGGNLSITIGAPANGNTTFVSTDLAATGFIDKLKNQVRVPRPVFVNDSESNLANQELRVSNDGDAEWISGDGTVTITVFYTIVALQ